MTFLHFTLLQKVMDRQPFTVSWRKRNNKFIDYRSDWGRTRTNQHPAVSLCKYICVPSWALGGSVAPYWRGNRTNGDPAVFLCKCIPRKNPYPAFTRNKSLPCICPEQILTLHLPRTNSYPAFATFLIRDPCRQVRKADINIPMEKLIESVLYWKSMWIMWICVSGESYNQGGGRGR